MRAETFCLPTKFFFCFKTHKKEPLSLSKIIQLSAADLEKCQKFANDVISTNIEQYKKRGQGNEEKIKNQIVTGKLGELAVAQAYGTNSPDFTIYEKRKKSFDADLKLGEVSIHVKTQEKESAEKYGASWTFQYSGNGFGHVDKLITAPQPHDVAAFLTINRATLECSLEAAVRCLLLPQLLSLPKLFQLYGSKRVVYLESIQQHHLFDLENYANLLRKDNKHE